MNYIFCKNQANMPLFEINSTDDRKSTIKNHFLHIQSQVFVRILCKQNPETIKSLEHYPA